MQIFSKQTQAGLGNTFFISPEVHSKNDGRLIAYENRGHRLGKTIGVSDRFYPYKGLPNEGTINDFISEIKAYLEKTYDQVDWTPIVFDQTNDEELDSEDDEFYSSLKTALDLAYKKRMNDEGHDTEGSILLNSNVFKDNKLTKVKDLHNSDMDEYQHPSGVSIFVSKKPEIMFKQSQGNPKIKVYTIQYQLTPDGKTIQYGDDIETHNFDRAFTNILSKVTGADHSAPGICKEELQVLSSTHFKKGDRVLMDWDKNEILEGTIVKPVPNPHNKGVMDYEVKRDDGKTVTYSEEFLSKLPEVNKTKSFNVFPRKNQKFNVDWDGPTKAIVLEVSRDSVLLGRGDGKMVEGNQLEVSISEFNEMVVDPRPTTSSVQTQATQFYTQKDFDKFTSFKLNDQFKSVDGAEFKLIDVGFYPGLKGIDTSFTVEYKTAEGKRGVQHKVGIDTLRKWFNSQGL